MKAAALVVALLAVPLAAAADEVWLAGGGRVSGAIVERTTTSVVMDVGAGRLTLPLSRVERVVSSVSSLQTYRERAARLGPKDLDGWLDLALWARDAGLRTQAREAFERVLAADPANLVANTALGFVRIDGRWVSQEEGWRAQGLVPFEGRWVRPEERDAELRERATRRDEALAGVARREAEARAREAEARARSAEAQAAAREGSGDSNGIPLWLTYGSPVLGGVSCARSHRRSGVMHPALPELEPEPVPVRAQTPAVRPRTMLAPPSASPRREAARHVGAN